MPYSVDGRNDDIDYHAPPKIAWTPRMSVINAEMKTIIKMVIITSGVGVPFSREPDLRRNHLRTHLTGKIMNNVHATVERKT